MSNPQTSAAALAEPRGELPPDHAQRPAPLPDAISIPGEVSDEQLLAAFRDQADRSAFEMLVKRYEKELFHYLRSFLKDHQAAEDIFQLAFLTVYRSSHQFQSGRRFRPWLYAIATNRAIDLQRSRKNRRCISLEASQAAAAERGGGTGGGMGLEVADSQPAVEQIAASAEEQEMLQKAMDDLPDASRQLLQLAYVQQLKYSDIGEMLDIPVGTVKSRVFYAVRRLRDVWQKRFPS